MENLFQANLNDTDLAQIFAASPAHQILPAAGSGAWDKVSRNPAVREWMVPLRERAAEEAGVAMPALTETLYHEFYLTGNRLKFDPVYFERRRRLGRAAICALLDKDNPAWLDSLRGKMHEILEEFSWALPAHVNSPSGKDPMQIDLMSAETANLMGELINVFGPALGGDLIQRARLRLHIQFFENYVNRHEDLAWTLSSGNWNAVCHQGVIGAALCVEEDLVMLARMLMLAKKYLPVYLGGFGNDGGCSEGPSYWEYGFGAFCALNEQLELRSNGQLSLLDGDAKIREIARFGPRASLYNFHFANFSDCPQSGFLDPALLTYLGERLRDDYLTRHALLHYQYLQNSGLNPDAEGHDFFFLSRLFLRCPADLAQTAEIEHEDVSFKNLAVVVAHGVDSKGNFWDFAAKGGGNNEQHNHNDCGSFILNINGVPMIVEIGAPEYTKDYFRERRYEYLAARTLGHSVPIANGCEQAAGPHYVSKTLNIEMEPERVHFCVDITNCYPPAADCGEIVRDFQWDKKRGVLQVKDYYELTRNESFESSIITAGEVTLSAHEAVVQEEGCRLVIQLLPETIFAGVEDHEYRDRAGVQRKVRRIILQPQKLDEQRFIGCEISLAD